MQALKDRDAEDADNLDDDMEIEKQESGLDCDPAHTTEYPTQNFFTPSEIQKTVTAEMEKSTSHRNEPCIYRTGGWHSY